MWRAADKPWPPLCPWVATEECCSLESPGLLLHDTKSTLKTAVDVSPLHLRATAALWGPESGRRPELEVTQHSLSRSGC